MSNGSQRDVDFREERSREDRLIFSAGLSVSLLAVIQLLQLTELDWALSFSLHCFTLSIPLSAMGVLLTDLELARRRHISGYLFVLVAGLIGLGAAMCGVVGLLLHLGCIGKSLYAFWEVAAIFGVGAAIVVYAVYRSYPRRG